MRMDTHPTVTSKMLLPTELETAMSPNPLRATITEVIKSGMEVPAAKNVRPITCGRKKRVFQFPNHQIKHREMILTSGGILAVSPATFAHQTMRYE